MAALSTNRNNSGRILRSQFLYLFQPQAMFPVRWPYQPASVFTTLLCIILKSQMRHPSISSACMYTIIRCTRVCCIHFYRKRYRLIHGIQSQRFPVICFQRSMVQQRSKMPDEMPRTTEEISFHAPFAILRLQLLDRYHIWDDQWLQTDHITVKTCFAVVRQRLPVLSIASAITLQYV